MDNVRGSVSDVQNGKSQISGTALFVSIVNDNKQHDQGNKDTNNGFPVLLNPNGAEDGGDKR